MGHGATELGQTNDYASRYKSTNNLTRDALLLGLFYFPLLGGSKCETERKRTEELIEINIENSLRYSLFIIPPTWIYNMANYLR